MNFFSGLIESGLEILETALIPRESYFQSKVDEMKSKLDNKFNFSLDLIVPVDSIGDTQSFSIPFLMGTTINFDWFNPYRFQFKGMLSVVFYVLTGIYIIKHLPEVYT